MTEIKDFASNFQPSRALHGFGSAEMPPVIFGGKGEAKHRPLSSGGVNNLGIHEIEDSNLASSRAGLCTVSAR
ncbi:MAG: hypothetical protein PUB00_08070 [Clostridiales bacterium]|nr:hypothetical protein [Clostridiales bacterium]